VTLCQSDIMSNDIRVNDALNTIWPPLRNENNKHSKGRPHKKWLCNCMSHDILPNDIMSSDILLNTVFPNYGIASNIRF
jgi:hypothetical protein